MTFLWPADLDTIKVTETIAVQAQLPQELLGHILVRAAKRFGSTIHREAQDVWVLQTGKGSQGVHQSRGEVMPSTLVGVVPSTVELGCLRDRCVPAAHIGARTPTHAYSFDVQRARDPPAQRQRPSSGWR